MRFLLISLCVLLFGSTALYSQAAVDFTAKDIEGKEHHLFQYLENNQFVLMDFFATH